MNVMRRIIGLTCGISLIWWGACGYKNNPDAEQSVGQAPKTAPEPTLQTTTREAPPSIYDTVEIIPLRFVLSGLECSEVMGECAGEDVWECHFAVAVTISNVIQSKGNMLVLGEKPVNGTFTCSAKDCVFKKSQSGAKKVTQTFAKMQKFNKKPDQVRLVVVIENLETMRVIRVISKVAKPDSDITSGEILWEETVAD